MWYFAWILGLALALSFGILNAMWFELRDDEQRSAKEPVRARTGSDRPDSRR